MLESGKLVKIEPLKCEFKKPLAIIINPNSGKKKDVRNLIELRL